MIARVFSASSSRFTAAFDFRAASRQGIVFIHAYVRDVTAVNALDKVVPRFRRDVRQSRYSE
ncbi:MAG: hypothetical protein DI599_09365 [Pseudomonas kuykendallii]|uniref:Uncharacterized protein n=1 Tax=Pseudomonas kuykendallii TaxID=1007099 RepID=A0A2W5EZ71_9PSED|nr:MAG: hypothetical protein DI599_09365 [Pseudomonas kuykendallii]